MGLPAEQVYWMTPRQISLTVDGYKTQEKAHWSRTLRQTQLWGDKATVQKLFSGSGRARATDMTHDKYMALKQRRGYA